MLYSKSMAIFYRVHHWLMVASITWQLLKKKARLKMQHKLHKHHLLSTYSPVAGGGCELKRKSEFRWSLEQLAHLCMMIHTRIYWDRVQNPSACGAVQRSGGIRWLLFFLITPIRHLQQPIERNSFHAVQHALCCRNQVSFGMQSSQSCPEELYYIEGNCIW